MEDMHKDHVETNLLYFKIYWNSINTTDYHTLHIQTHPVITQFLQPEAEQLLLFRILLASVVLTTFFLNVQTRVHGGCRLQSNKKYRYEIEILKCSSNVRHIWRWILTPCTQCSWRWSQFRIQFLIHVVCLKGFSQSKCKCQEICCTGPNFSPSPPSSSSLQRLTDERD